MDAASENPTIYADLTEPQSLNKYQYCYNNPLSFIDIDGHKGWREWLKTGLEVASYVPGPIGAGASLVQAGIAVAQGDYKGAALAAMGAIPGGKILAKVGAAVATVAVAAVVVKKAVKAGDISKLAKRAEQVHSALHPVAQTKRTTAALATTNAQRKSVTVIGGGKVDLIPAQRAKLKRGEVV